jgi:cytochrome c2
VGRDAASVANFTKYSDGLKKLRESGIPDANERADVIAYLKTQ